MLTVNVLASTPASVSELFAVSVLPLATVSVAEVAGAVIATLLMLVAVATPKTGVVMVGDVIVGDAIVGEVAKTALPVPVSSVSAAAKFADVGVCKNVATLVPSDVIPVPPRLAGSVPVVPALIGSPTQLVSVPAEGVPILGLVSVTPVRNVVLVAC